MKQVYIVLSQTGTLFSRLIKRFTGDPFNHSAIAFHRSLDVMYSFGRKHPVNILHSGFVEENFWSGVVAHYRNNYCRVIEVEVTDKEYDAMLAEVSEFLRRREQYTYNILGIIGFKTGLSLRMKDSFFCSQFVSHILRNTECWRGRADFVKPMDFCQLGQAVYEGPAKDYDCTNLPPYDILYA